MRGPLDYGDAVVERTNRAPKMKPNRTLDFSHLFHRGRGSQRARVLTKSWHIVVVVQLIEKPRLMIDFPPSGRTGRVAFSERVCDTPTGLSVGQ